MLALFTTVRKLTEMQLAAIFEFHIDSSTSCSDALTAKEKSNWKTVLPEYESYLVNYITSNWR
jgi:hypothetical protein